MASEVRDSEAGVRGARLAAGDSEQLRWVERSLALVCRNLFREPNALLAIGRFELIRTVGRGGMGVVYEVFDPLRRSQVALKMLHGRSPTHLYRLKREFRSLAALSHPNLAALHELSVGDDEAYFTMELVPGIDFVSYVRGDAPSGELIGSEPRLRDALTQLCEGVNALHRAGKLHRDLKPSNVLVEESGRVVLLDFGLVHDAYDGLGEAEGTPAYMAPEQAAGRACESSDWYSVGLILRDALRGPLPRFLPHRGLALDEESAVTERLPPALAELDALSQRLLHPDPAERPNGDQIAAILRGECRRVLVEVPGAAPRRNELFVGRASELSKLTEAFAQSLAAPRLLLIRGESGIGKTELVRQFVVRVLSPAGALVLSGRCYERESVPYKALDSIIDELSRHLCALPDEQVAALRPDDCAALVHIFPVLGRVPALRDAGQSAGRHHPVELRARGFAALKVLLRRLASIRPLVLCIDDIQWSDTDSGQLFGALLGEDDAPALLVVASDRTDPCMLNPAIEELQRVCELSRRPSPLVELTLAALSPAEASELAEVLLARASRAENAPRFIELVASESRGNPLFLAELSRWVSGHAPATWQDGERASIDALLGSRLRVLPEQSRLVLELIALAGRPVPSSVITHAAGLDYEPYALIKELRGLRLIHAVRRADEELLELDHDRIAEAVLRRIAVPHRQDLHARLARAFEASSGSYSEALVDQYIGAEMPLQAAQHARQAGDLALATLAFSRAAWLYEQALRLGQWSTAELSSLNVDLARALEHSGRGLEAASAYRRAAALTEDPIAAVQIEQQAANHLTHNGEHAEGERLLRHGYQVLGLPWPRSRLLLLLSTLRYLLPPFWRRRRFSRRVIPQSLRRARAEYTAHAGSGIEGYDMLRALHNALVCFDESEQLDDPVWQARVHGGRGLLMCVSLARGGIARGLAQLERAGARAEELGDVRAAADILRQLAMAYYLNGKARKALDIANKCERMLRSLPLVSIDLYEAMGTIGAALLDLGELREVAVRYSAFAHEARLHGDLTTSFWIHSHPAQFAVLFAADDRAAAQVVLAQQARVRALHPHFRLLIWSQAICAAECELYWGSALTTAQRIEDDWRSFGRTGYAFLTESALMLRARAQLGVASTLPRARRGRLLRRASSDLERACPKNSPLRLGMMHLQRASVQVLRERPDRALSELAAALPPAQAAEQKLVVACVRYCHGALLGGDVGRALTEEAERQLRAEGILEPRRWVAWTAPGFRDIVGALDA